eukprot:TRINITY_DN5604_c0_g1_i1.p1 TRINITY_DN5604_c0_g1~~TRINITY_DN5604_c0_g1_i1.p1  ORF type:complete len:148 (-),score=12.42 TRINITY_DN5604_c0_g1_i1:136-579(-)
MTILYVLIANRQGQTRLARYFNNLAQGQRAALEGEIVRKCLGRGVDQCMYLEYRDHKVIFRRYASLFVILGVDHSENELASFELIHLFVESLDQYFSSVCELDIMFNLDRAHMILDEIILNGNIVETSKATILEPIVLLDKYTKKNT